jgi:release factor glutamine methyltransferase
VTAGRAAQSPAGFSERQSVAAARRALSRAFAAAGLETPELDARVLIGYALGLDHAALASAADRELSAAEAESMAALAARRLAHEPVARIVGQKEFWGLPLRLNAAALVPRPETETVVEAALAALGERRASVLRAADLGTGSGALLLALMSECPSAWGVGTDVTPHALTCARDNALSLGLGGRTAFVCCDYGAALAGPFDLIVANPPYIVRDDIETLQPEVRLYDPRRALDGGPDGLDAYRAIAADAHRLLAANGTMVIELGQGQLGSVSSIFTTSGLAPVGHRHDLSGVGRALVVKPLP